VAACGKEGLRSTSTTWLQLLLTDGQAVYLARLRSLSLSPPSMSRRSCTCSMATASRGRGMWFAPPSRQAPPFTHSLCSPHKPWICVDHVSLGPFKGSGLKGECSGGGELLGAAAIVSGMNGACGMWVTVAIIMRTHIAFLLRRFYPSCAKKCTFTLWNAVFAEAERP
jgi:hypothetical protein